MFPLNYFKTIFSPVACFVNRNYLRIWQMLILILLHVGLLLMPMSYQIGNIQSVDLDRFIPKAVSLVTDDVARQLNQLKVNDNQLDVKSTQVVTETESTIVGLAPSKSEALQMLGDKVGIMFTPTEFIVRESKERQLTQPYIDAGKMTTYQAGNALLQEMSQQWFKLNRLNIVLTSLIETWLLFTVSFAILVFGASGFLSLMRLSPLFDIANYKEALTVSYNCFGVPTFVAMVVGFITSDPIAMMTTQGIGYVLMLLFVYWRTHFQDRYVETQRNKEAVE